MKFIVLGGYGIIGKAVVNNLFRYAKNAEIIIAGRDLKKADEYAKSFKSNKVKAKRVDINNQKQLINLLKGTDVCINCIQYYFNLQIMKACLKARTNYVDLGGLFHYTKKQLKLNKQFKKIEKTAILGVGGAPGISNILAVYGSRFLNKIKDLEITFADQDSTIYNQKFVLPYSFKTLVDEYTLKPAIFENGKIKFVKPHSGVKDYIFPYGFGKKEGFLTLHSEIATLPKFLRNKGIKKCEFRVTFPKEFSSRILKLIELGFTSHEKLDFRGKDIPILDITSEIMDKLIPKQGTFIKDSEIIRIILNDGNIIVDAITKSDGKTAAGILDTAIPCSIVSQMLASGLIEKKGVYAPEQAIDYDLFFTELALRNIRVFRSNLPVN